MKVGDRRRAVTSATPVASVRTFVTPEKRSGELLFVMGRTGRRVGVGREFSPGLKSSGVRRAATRASAPESNRLENAA